MSLSVAGVWAVGVWDQTVWGEGVWREGAYTPASTAKGGYVPPTYVKTRRKRKDDSIRESIEALLTEVKAAPVVIPQKVENDLREVYDKAPEVINLKPSVERIQKLAALNVEISQIRKTVKRIVKEEQEDEEAAIQALLEII